jgi:hypothetical protein
MRSLLFTTSLLARTCSSLVVTIRNDVPRVDQHGAIVNAHDGSVVSFPDTPWNGTYFMYGTVYENCTQNGPQCSGCGYSPNTFGLYTTADMESFVFVTANILPEAAKDVRLRGASHARAQRPPHAPHPPRALVFRTSTWTIGCPSSSSTAQPQSL